MSGYSLRLGHFISDLEFSLCDEILLSEDMSRMFYDPNSTPFDFVSMFDNFHVELREGYDQ